MIRSSLPSTYPYVAKREYFVVQDARPLYHWPEKIITSTKHDNWEPQFKPKVVERPKSATVVAPVEVVEVVSATPEGDNEDDDNDNEDENNLVEEEEVMLKDEMESFVGAEGNNEELYYEEGYGDDSAPNEELSAEYGEDNEAFDSYDEEELPDDEM